MTYLTEVGSTVLISGGMQDFHTSMEEDLKRAAVIVVGGLGPHQEIFTYTMSTSCTPCVQLKALYASDNLAVTRWQWCCQTPVRPPNGAA